MESYYELLEVSNKASPEVIEKAYKVLVKKYHPDVQTDTNKKTTDEMIKKINQAYEVLMDVNKRTEYDIKLEELFKKEEKKTKVNPPINMNNKDEISEKLRQKIELEKQAKKAYNDAYHKYLTDLGYKVKVKRTFKQWLKYWWTVILTIIVIALVFWLLWLIPPINRTLKSLYNENYFINTIKEACKTVFGGK